jgi:hypothetical protein
LLPGTLRGEECGGGHDMTEDRAYLSRAEVKK